MGLESHIRSMKFQCKAYMDLRYVVLLRLVYSPNYPCDMRVVRLV
uniref:Uncharacterized protein n=1 Tax=Rhizophora mucronata TaxID=61149 RepID=A0A2P2QSS7_RHIMU